jgi:NAD(P)-dependent dehydrogenase (short-subunit alcohol dehydrogenase family)
VSYSKKRHNEEFGAGMPTVLITGASRGLGREFVRQYEGAGWRVIATCRDPAGTDVTCECHALDVSDPVSVDAVGSALSGEAIDVLINNAGIYGPRDYGPDSVPYDEWESVLRTNLLAPMRVAAALMGSVARSDRKLMVFLSSIMGSIGGGGGGQYIYRSSKAALNAAVSALAKDIRPKDVGCLLLHPGWVQTDMGGSGAAIDAVTSVTGMRQVIEGWSIDETGMFRDYAGEPIPW